MAQQDSKHPLAPHPGTEEEGPLPVDNSRESVRLRSGIEVGAMRYVLVIGIILAVAAMFLAWWMGYLAF